MSGKSLLDEYGIEYFQGASIFGALTPEVIGYLLDNGKIFHLEKGDVLYNPGDKGSCFYVILKGRISFYSYHLGEFAYLRDYKFGEELGFSAMIALHDRIGKAEAAEECCVIEISTALFHELHDRYPNEFGIVLLNLARDMARIIRNINYIIVDEKAGKISKG